MYSTLSVFLLSLSNKGKNAKKKQQQKLFMALVDNNKNINKYKYRQPYHLISWCTCYLPLAPVTIVALRELDKVHQYSVTDMTLQSSLTWSIQNMAIMCSRVSAPTVRVHPFTEGSLSRSRRNNIVSSFLVASSPRRLSTRRLPALSLCFCGSTKVTACGFAKIIIKWLVQYKRPLHTCLSKRRKGPSPAVRTVASR